MLVFEANSDHANIPSTRLLTDCDMGLYRLIELQEYLNTCQCQLLMQVVLIKTSHIQ